MASVCNSTTTLKTPFTSSTSSLASTTPKPSQLFLHGKRNQTFKVSCKVSNNDQNQNVETNSVDRRNVLLGLGGLYGVANAMPLAASATPIPPPDLTACGRATISDGPEVPYSCCPPKPDDMSKIPYYKFPSATKLRVRQPAHAVDEEYIAKYNLAISRMKELDTKDPLNPLGFKQQANIHCAYCNGAYVINGKVLQIHNSWLFFPFHRWYLYFYERILGHLIDDPTFALPYWNWDNPKGMRLPPMFDRKGTNLYDERRNQNAIGNGAVMDLGSFGDKVDTTQLQLMSNNLTLMYRQMVTNAPCPLLFFGAPYVLGNNVEAPGTIENIPHIPVHIWVGTVRDSILPGGGRSYGEDMGNFYSAGLDPVFYCHHGNVDRMWNEWKAIGGKRRDLLQKDWLNSEFFFYDEHKNPYLVKVRDCLDSKKMGYDYAPMPTPWRNFKPIRKTTAGKVNTAALPPASQVFPLAKMDKTISFSIDRPATSRTQQDKSEQEEMLTFNGIKFDNRQYIRFDVYLNLEKNVNPNELDKAEFAGSFTSLPHVHLANQVEHISTATFQLAITELLEDMGLEDEKTIAVTLVPRKGGEGTSIEGVQIDLAACT